MDRKAISIRTAYKIAQNYRDVINDFTIVTNFRLEKINLTEDNIYARLSHSCDLSTLLSSACYMLCSFIEV